MPIRTFTMPIWLFTMTDPAVHDADPAVHDGPIRLFTMGRFPHDPLAQDCDQEELCVLDETGADFTCVPDASGDGGQTHDPCAAVDACDHALHCAPPGSATECDPNAPGCCEPFCLLDEPNICPGQGQECIPYAPMDVVPPEYANVGFCSLPP